MQNKLLPVLLGADMNCYSVARAFHEAYGVKSQAFGRYAMGETKYSRIVDFTAVPEMESDDVLLATLDAFAAAHPVENKILMGCTDGYVEMIIRNREALAEKYIVPYIGAELQKQLESKDSFYALCEQYGIPYPATVVLRSREDLLPNPQDGTSLLHSLPFAYPIIIKPASSITYWQHEFEGMKKVYVAKDAAEAEDITKRIFNSGYPDSIILQDMIPGADAGMRVLTAYSDRHCKVKMMCLGHVLLEEHTPRAVGNHAAILTEYDRPLMEKLCGFLDSLGYTGFANFDIKYDPRDGSYRVFEINLRQGRSNYYVTGAGLNIARYVVQDRVDGADLGEPLFFQGDSFWRSIPERVVWDYTDAPVLVEKAQHLAKAGKASTALGYKYDTFMNPLRWAYLQVHMHRYYDKYARYCPKPGEGRG